MSGLDNGPATIAAVQRSDGRYALHVPCVSNPMADHCEFSVWQKPAEGAMWQWDGNVERPTVTPSIDCLVCKRHFTVVAGEPIGDWDRGSA